MRQEWLPEDVVACWAAEHRHGNATTAQSIALAGRISGMDLHPLNMWLYDRGRPTRW